MNEDIRKPNIVVIYSGDDACTQCLGWKRVDDGDGVSWKYWAELPGQSMILQQMGLVKPIVCPHCKGIGKEPDDILARYEARREK